MDNKDLEQSLDLQDHLTDDRMKIIGKAERSRFERPTGSLSALMDWTCLNFAESVFEETSYKKYIHNKITIDGPFLQFCEENRIKVSSLMHDGVTSWKSSHGHEHFIAMGVFLIEKDDLIFIQGSLFHKGNQNEDEVNFFVIVPDKCFRKYTEFRNSFQDWEKKRDHSNLEIEVIGGAPIPYSKDLTWDDVYLTEDVKKQVVSSVDGFIKCKERYKSLKLPWKRGLIFWGPRGNGKTSTLKVIMSQYDLKPVTIMAGSSSTDELLEEAWSYAQDHAPALLFFEDFQEMLQNADTRLFLNLMDGVQERDGILVIATGNDIKDLEDNIINRPRRFDKKIMFPLPDFDISLQYLKKWFSKHLKDEVIKKIAKKAVRSKFTFSHLQEIYFNAASIAVRNDRDEPTEEDILVSVEEVISENFKSDESRSVSIMDYNNE